MSVIKQLHINHLPIPECMHTIIKEYSFYDVKIIEAKLIHKTFMNEIVEKFDNAYCSRIYPSDYWVDETFEGDYDSRNFPRELCDKNNDPETLEKWSTCLTDYDDVNQGIIYEFEMEPVFEAENCKLCGNYKVSKCGYNVYSLKDAFKKRKFDLYNRIKSRMPKNLRCECIII